MHDIKILSYYYICIYKINTWVCRHREKRKKKKKNSFGESARDLSVSVCDALDKSYLRLDQVCGID